MPAETSTQEMTERIIPQNLLLCEFWHLISASFPARLSCLEQIQYPLTTGSANLAALSSLMARSSEGASTCLAAHHSMSSTWTATNPVSLIVQ